MNLYVIRHGQTDWNIDGVFQGRKNVPLNKLGRKQALETAEKFKNITVDVILCSPLSRAIDTAKPISEVTGVPITIDEQLIERSFGKWEGKKPTEDVNIKKLLNIELNYSDYNIEPVKQLLQRVRGRFEQIKKEYSGKNVVIVSHAGVIEALNSCFQEIPQDSLAGIGINNCEVKHFTVAEV